MKTEIQLQKYVDGKKIRATIEVEIKTRQGEFQTIHHELIKEFKEVSISGSITGGNHGSHGQCIDEIAKEFSDDENVQAIHRVWSQYHLNGMAAGCVHQVGGSYGDDAMMKQVCPESGYKYGSKWLVRLVPEVELVRLTNAVNELRGSKAPTHIEDFCTKHGVKIESVIQIDESKDAIEYRIKLARGKKTFVIPSFRMGREIKSKFGHPKKPGLNDVLQCLISDSRCASVFEDFCSDLGYDEDSREAEKIFKAVELQTKQLKEFLGDAFDEFVEVETE